MMNLTEEQRDIVHCDLQPGEILKVMAFAGTGKTSTLVAYAQARPGMRFLYVAFNKSVQLEASARFPANVTARTCHALAFRTHGIRHRDRLVPHFRANTVMQALGLQSCEDARFTIETLYNYLVSADPKVVKRHIPRRASVLYEQKGAAPPDFVDLANRLGRRMCDEADQQIGMLHDGYLKLFQLSDPVLDYDCIFLDEAQDVNPVAGALVLSQARSDRPRAPASIILVGDHHQQIYTFRGARDTLARIAASRTKYLTRSFRFNNAIARVANMVLQTFKGETRRIAGRPLHGTRPAWDKQKYTVIARTNAGLFDKAVALSKTRTIGFLGGFQGCRLQTLRDVHFLCAGRPELVVDPYIRGFDDYRALKRYAAAVEDLELLSLCAAVEKYEQRLPLLVDDMMRTAVPPESAQVVLTTAHKAKGLEWNNVLLMGDFLDLVRAGRLIDPTTADPDEFNLIYVAVTRAIDHLRFDKQSSLPAFIELLRGKVGNKSKKHGEE